jgi:hypothetical protein
LGKGSTTTTNEIHLGQQGSFENQLFGSQGNSAEIDKKIAQLKKIRGANPFGGDAYKEKIDAQIASLNKKRTTGSGGLLQKEFGNFQSMINAGPGAADIAAGVGAQRDLASMLQAYSKSGGVPGQEDISTANSFAKDIFAAREMQMQNLFKDQQTQSNQQLAMMGRDINDPIMRAKMFEQQQRESGMLGAEKQGFAAQYAQALPGQRLGFAAQRADVLSALGDRAQQNRLALLGIGSSLGEAERAWRLNTATRTSRTEKETGLGDIVTGAIGLGGTALGFANLLGGGGGAGAMGAGGAAQAAGGAARTIASAPSMGAMNQGPMLPNGGFSGYGGQTSIFQAFPNFPGAGFGTGPMPAYGNMGARRAY